MAAGLGDEGLVMRTMSDCDSIYWFSFVWMYRDGGSAARDGLWPTSLSAKMR